MIEISRLVKKYGDHYAVKDLNFHVEEGMIYGFLGPNGAGKSTTMNIITGYLAPTSGEVKIDGHDIVTDAQAAKKLIGYLPEIPPLYPDMTVEEYMRFAAELKNVPAAQRKAAVQAAMDIAKITDMSKRLIANLSKGYKQRVGLAQAVLGDPPVIILDEPTVGLDPKQILEMRELIRGLKQKHTVILSSHILSEVSAVCDRILILSKGELVASDTPEGLIGRMQGGARLTLTVKGEKDRLEKALISMDAFETVEYISEEAGCTTAVLTQKAESDAREALFYTLAENELPIYSLEQGSRSLEDIFLKLTENDAQPEEVSDAVPEAEEESAALPEAVEMTEEGNGDDSDI